MTYNFCFDTAIDNLFLYPEGKLRRVEQLHCTAWPDMEAPKDTKTLLDLFKYTEKTLLVNPNISLNHNLYPKFWNPIIAFENPHLCLAKYSIMWGKFLGV
jgi:hypothetical protein